MFGSFLKKKVLPRVAFATSCWEKDWKQILNDSDYLRTKQIGNHLFPFSEKILVINNVTDLKEVKQAAEEKVEKGILTKVVVSEKISDDVLSFFRLKREDFQPGSDAHLYENVNPDWVYYNALGPLSAIYSAHSDYLLYMTGDVYLDKPVDWIRPALQKMEKNRLYKVANLTWNRKYKEAKKEAFFSDGPFFVAKDGFSDQMFLVKQEDFRQPIYDEIREDASHFPRGDVFEKRCFSYMKNRGWMRITYRRGSYLHENI